MAHASLEAEDVRHVVEAGRPPGDPLRGAHGAAGELLAGGRPVRELQALALAAEEDGVLADDVAAAQRLDPDLPGRPLAEDAVPRVRERVLRIAAERLGRHLAEPDGRARRRVALLLVVHLDDLDVVVVAEDLRGLA